MTGVFQTHVLPGLATVDGLVNTVTVTDAALRVIFTTAHPDDIRVGRIDFDHANGK